jgi:hypothetical protein
MATATTTRRAAFGAIGSIAAAGILASHTARALANPDADIEAAFQRRQQAYAAYNALPIDNQPVVDGYGPGERELMAVIDAAEDVIRRAVATTPRGVMLQLWCAMYHSITKSQDDDALTRADFAAIDRIDSDLDWNARLMLAGLRSLQAMEA